jgi:ATP-binding cassette subfamily F protein 3
MVPMIRNILGGFLFEGDDVYKKAAVLSGGERTRLAVARMLLRPSNTLLLDEPTNHLDLDSKDVLLDALEDFGGTLILVSHDRYFIDKLATKIIEIGNGEALVYPGGYEEFLWSRAQQQAASNGKPNGRGDAKTKTAPAATPAARGATPSARVHAPGAGRPERPTTAQNPRPAPPTGGNGRDRAEAPMTWEEKKRHDAELRRQRRAADALQKQVAALEATIADREREMKELEAAMAAPGFYEDHLVSKPIIDRHQALMWELGDLMHRWEELSAEAESASASGQPS